MLWLKLIRLSSLQRRICKDHAECMSLTTLLQQNQDTEAILRTSDLPVQVRLLYAGDWVRVTQECWKDNKGKWITNTRFAFKSLCGAHLGANKKSALPSDLMEGFAIICEEPDYNKPTFRPQVRISETLWELSISLQHLQDLLATQAVCLGLARFWHLHSNFYRYSCSS